MDKLMEKVKKELENIAEKGLSASNLETTYKLIDIYKDIKEAEYYESEIKEEQGGDYSMPQRRDSRGRYMNDGYDRYYDPVIHGGYDNRGYDNRGYDNRSGHGGTIVKNKNNESDDLSLQLRLFLLLVFEGVF